MTGEPDVWLQNERDALSSICLLLEPGGVFTMKKGLRLSSDVLSVAVGIAVMASGA